jgi:hypothetical protein
MIKQVIEVNYRSQFQYNQLEIQLLYSSNNLD